MQNKFCFYSWFLKVFFYLNFFLLSFSKQSHGICPIKISKMEENTQKTYSQVETWNNTQNHISGCALKVSLFLFAFYFFYLK